MSAVSSSAPLEANAEFISDWERRRPGIRSLFGSVFADKAGILHIEQSRDGVNADVSEPIEVKAGDGQGFTEVLVADFWRVRYTNGGTKQTAFRLAATLGA